MFHFDGAVFSTDDFSDQTRLLLVEHLVMFPRVMAMCLLTKASHIAMAEEAMHTDNLITVGVAAAPFDVACLCRILGSRRSNSRQKNSGQKQLVLMGIHRVRVGVPVELSAQRGLRQAELCEDEPVDDPTSVIKMQFSLRAVANDLWRAGGLKQEACDQFDSIFAGQIPLGGVCDILASMFDLDIVEKGVVLAEVNVEKRATALLHLLVKLAIRQQLDRSTSFANLGDFSEN